MIDVCPRVTADTERREVAASHPLVEGISTAATSYRSRGWPVGGVDELERLLAIFDQGLVKRNGRGDAHMLMIEEGEYPAECGFVLRQLREALAEEEVRRNMEGSICCFGTQCSLLARQVEHHERCAEKERLLLAQAISRMHGLGQRR